MLIWLAALFSLFVTMACVPVFRRLALHYQAVDMPNERKVHSRPMAKTGGLAMAVGALVPILLWMPSGAANLPLLLSCLLIVGFGFLDDLKDLSSKAKFSVQCLAALIVIFGAGLKITTFGGLLPSDVLLPDMIAVPLTLIVIVGVTNAINLADGLDGLAGGIALLSYVCIAYLAYLCNRVEMTLIAAAMAGAIFGFLRFNTYPASVFMGDAGSQLLGFLAIVLSLDLTQSGTPYSPILPLLLLGFPILDTLTVMIERIANGRSPFVADKNHFHHRLMQHGLTHAEAVFTIYLLQTGLIAGGIFFRYYSDWLLLAGYLCFSIIILTGLRVAHFKQWRFNEISATRFHLRGRLSRLLTRGRAIQFSFRALQWLFLLILPLAALIPENLSGWFAIPAGLLFVALGLSYLYSIPGPNLLCRFIIYLVMPFLFYLGEEAGRRAGFDYFANATLILLVVFVIAVIRFSRRSGYKSTPLDYLVLMIALIVPNLNLFDLPELHLGMITAKLLILFFSIEVLLEESRYKIRHVVIAELLMLSIILVRTIS